MIKKRYLIYILLVIIFTLFNFYFRPIKGNPLITKEYKNSDRYINDLYMSQEYFKENLLDKDDYYIYDEIINSSLHNKNKVTINCYENCQSKLLNSYYAVYLDHPELISFVGINYYNISNNKITYENYGNLSEIKTFFGTKRIAREMENIRNDTKNMTDKEKIIYVYDYVASHNYDKLFTFTKSNQSAYSFFTGGKSVCAGFAKASQLIFQNIGINSYLVLSTTHMWNYVEYEGKYYVYDATIGASLSDKKSPYFYDGLGKTTIKSTTGMFSDLYPKIETTTLKEVFGL
ncbi:MAG: transglutaminase domain-containing protein [Bacilli bacterium]|nr:transglutaminase domain-containing protein [Bacilli bacterium]